MSKIVSFSLFGDNPKYLVGAVINARLVKEYYKDWTPVFYVGRSVPNDIIEKIENEGGRIIHENGIENSSATIWRFKPICDSKTEYLIVRDCDSRIGYREVAAVNEWIKSGKSFHIMRDHPMHNTSIMAGLWGVKGDALKHLCGKILSKEWNGYYGVDQDFLNDYVYNLALKSSVIHDSFFKRELISKKFPTPRTSHEFVGEVFDENENYNVFHRDILKTVVENYFKKNFVKIKSMKYLFR
jgi:protein O-GlcNAc transferase